MARKKPPRDDQAAPSAEVESLLPIARALKESIEAKLLGGGEAVIDVDDAWSAAVASVAERLIAERLQELDPERVLRLYAECVDDETLRAQLGEWVAAKAAERDAIEQLARLRRAVSSSRAVDLPLLDDGVRVELGMFDRRQIAQARKESSLPPARTIAFRLVDAGRGYAEVISDTTLSRSGEGAFAPQVRGSVGSLVTDGGQERLEPRLQVHAPLGFDFGSGPARTEEIIGFVDVGQGMLVAG